MILIDSNVIIDVSQNDPVWKSWSADAIASAVDSDEVEINPIIYSEIAPTFSTLELLEASLASMSLRRLNLPYEAAYLAGRVHREYRRRGGERLATLPDFLIGAHAAIGGFVLLTRDARRFGRAFPTLKIIAHDVHEEAP